MAKSTDERPDKKQIEKTLKNIKKVCDQLKECSKELKGVSAIAKELDKVTGPKK
jgi:hypothetical protein